MRKSTFSEAQIVGILKDAESGVPVADLLRKHGVSKATFFKWRSKYGGATVADVKRLRELEAENAKLKRMYAALAFENAAIKGCAEPKAVGPSAKRQVIGLLVDEHQLTVQQACRVVRLSRTAYYRSPVPASRRDAAVIAALTDVVARFPRWGFWKRFDCMRTEGRTWHHKRVHRVYCALRLESAAPHDAARAEARAPAAGGPDVGARLHGRHVPRRPAGAPVDDARRRESGGARDRDRALAAQPSGRAGTRRARGGTRLSVVDSRRQRARVHGAALRRLVRRPPRHHPLHSARDARSECLHRTLQSHVSHGGAQCPSGRIGRGTPSPDRRLASDLQPRAAPRQPRPGAATYVSPEAFIRRTVSSSTVNLTGQAYG